MVSPSAMEAKDYYLFRIVLIGDSGVGKTSIIRQCIDGRSVATHGFDFSTKSLRIGSSKVKLQIWDTAGQERYRAITRSYYHSANAIVLVYDIGDTTSFRNLPEWLSDVERCAGSNITRILVGNKSDRTDRQITQQQGQQFGKKYDMAFLETSAKNSNNIDELFLQLAKMLLESHINQKPRSNGGGANSGSLIRVSASAPVQGYSSGGKPPLTVTPKTVNKQANVGRGGCC